MGYADANVLGNCFVVGAPSIICLGLAQEISLDAIRGRHSDSNELH